MAVTPPPSVDSTRYAYLVDRLRTRRITMEEATELFALQQAIIRAAYAARAASTPPPPSDAGLGGSAPPRSAPPPAGASLFGTDDALLLGILGLGAGAGLLAAIAKHARGEPPRDSLPARRKDSG